MSELLSMEVNKKDLMELKLILSKTSVATKPEVTALLIQIMVAERKEQIDEWLLEEQHKLEKEYDHRIREMEKRYK